MGFKSGFVAIVGRPNVGKSTFLNKIIGQKVAITSSKPQTTRKRIRGIYTSEEEGQIVFVDTPGIYKPLHKLGEFLLDEAKMAVPDADLILFFVDGNEKAGPGDKWIVENILKADTPIIMVVNKVDVVKSLEVRDENVDTYRMLFGANQVPILKISGMTGRNTVDLLRNIFRALPEGPMYYSEDDLTDQNLRTISEEIIRESVLRNTEEEVPHSVAVKVQSFEEKEKLVRIQADIYVERDSQKGILIGKQGSMLKKVGTFSRLQIEKLLEKKVYLELFVKVKKDWRQNQNILKDLGYQQD